MEATTNLIGGQPFSMANLKEVRQVAAAARHPRDHRLQPDLGKRLFHQAPRAGLRRRLDRRRSSREMMDQADLIYLSGRKSTCVRGGLIATNNPKYFEQLKAWLPLYEGFITYGGMSSKEIEAMAVGIREMVDYDVASSSADLINYFVDEMVKRGIPAVTPPGGLAGHVDAMRVPAPRAASRVYGRGADRRRVPRLRRARHGTGHHLDGPRCPGQRRLLRRGTLPPGRAAPGLQRLAHGLRRRSPGLASRSTATWSGG